MALCVSQLQTMAQKSVVIGRISSRGEFLQYAQAQSGEHQVSTRDDHAGAASLSSAASIIPSRLVERFGSAGSPASPAVSFSTCSSASSAADAHTQLQLSDATGARWFVCDEIWLQDRTA
jgi:hypothetical protein